MGDSLHHPHDGLVKHTLGNPATAAALAHPIVEAAAPLLAKRIKWDQFTRESVTFVSRHLAHVESDVLYRSCTDDGRPVYIYVLYEHQSSPDKLMAFRLLEYVVSIWKHHRTVYPDSGDLLPLVIPIVTYASPRGRPWTAATQLADLIDVDDELRVELEAFLPRLGYLLNDLTVTPLDELLARPGSPSSRVLQVVLKVAPRNRRLHIELRPLEQDLRQVDHDDLVAFLAYIIEVGDTADEDFETFAAEIGSEAREAFMTTASRLQAKGRAEGRVELLVELMTKKFGPIPARVVDAVRGAGRDQLDVWADRLLSAQTLDDLGIV
ncbi:Rpn family recombination-promoting nuclease/putative transposase [Nocardia rhizosphaerae]|uniref:Rpn family recombination-promoting nuclease/putative transposase n=1 Tax=Nocardia rhizosphaerae TaxID=1691571 RepID=A0ABV8LAG7_9NOCA